MERFADVEKVTTKAEMEAFKSALVAQDKANAGKKKRARPANNKNGRTKLMLIITLIFPVVKRAISWVTSRVTPAVRPGLSLRPSNFFAPV